MSVSCATVRRRLVHFQADELPAAERRAIEAHLAACPPCERRFELEDELLHAIKRGLVREEAPAELRWRVQAALQRAPTSRPGPRWLRGPWGLALAATLFLAAGLGLLVRELGPASASVAAVEPVLREVLVVDRSCDEQGVPIAEQRRCPAGRHVNALLVGERRYWSPALDSEEGRRLVLDPDLRGARIEVEGELYPRIGTLRVRRFEVLERVARHSTLPGPRGGELVASGLR